jgi:hypothetical protein
MLEQQLLLEFEEMEQGPNPKKHRGPNIDRNLARGAAQIFNDYFSDNPTYTERQFRRRFRMSSKLCKRIIADITLYDQSFAQQYDAAGKPGASEYQKVTAALRFLAYGTSPDALDEYIRLSEVTISKYVKRFAKNVVDLYGKTYLRTPTAADIQLHCSKNAERGFPGMFASIDCIHFEWDMCPSAFHGQHRNKDKKKTMVMEAFATQDTWIWHAFYGMPGSCNDLNVLDNSPFIAQLMEGHYRGVHEFEVNGRVRDQVYLLTDGIYPAWACFQKGYAQPVTDKQKLFAQKVSAARKDVERSFGVLRKRWSWLKQPCRMYFVEDIGLLLKCCLILHNMVIEDERHESTNDTDYLSDGQDPNASDNGVIAPQPDREKVPTPMQTLLENLRTAQSLEEHQALKPDIMEHLWNSFRI